MKTEEAKAIAVQRVETLRRDAERLVAADFKPATTEDARTAQYQAAFEEMFTRMQEADAARRDSIARLSQASPEYRVARAAFDAIKKELD